MIVQHFGRDVRREPRAVITVGVFDGVHLGHRAVLETVVHRAQQTDGVATVVTFDPHPQEVVGGGIVPLLTTVSERVELLEAAGIQRVVVVRFDKQFAARPAETYVREDLYEAIGLQEIVVGHDHGFGKGRKGDRALLDRMARALDFKVSELSVRKSNDTTISSSNIRESLVARGDVEAAARLLGRRYTLSGSVVKGDGRGKGIGFPTANIAVGHTRKIVPLRGVYAVAVQLEGDGALFGGMANIGFRPTFDGSTLRIEVHVFDLKRELYGEWIQLEFVKRIRDERKFGGIEPLREQLYEDRARCSDALAAIT